MHLIEKCRLAVPYSTSMVLVYTILTLVPTRNTRYRPKHAVLGSREQMCVNPKVKHAGSTGADINHECNRLGQERKCQFRNKLEGFTAPNNETSQTGTQPVRDMEDLVSMGQTHRVCPFYYTRSLVEDAELILVPYNYLFDKDSRTSTLADVPWKNAVVIFDEAHNLESFASESASFDLTTTDIGGCIGEIQRAVNYVQTFGSTEDGGGKVRPENIAKLKVIFMKLEEYIMNTLSSQTMSYKGEFMMELFQKGAGINHANHELFIAEVRKLTDIFLQLGGSSGGKGGGGGGAPRLEYFVQCVKRVFGEPTEARCYAKAQSYRVHITQKQAQPSSGSNNNKNNSNSNRLVGRTVSYWCFAPSEAMRELANLEVRSILVTSGTLSPLESYALELDLPFPHRLENPHIIPEDQIHVRVVGKGVSNKLLSSSYENRQNDEYYTELGNTLISLGKIIPGGMLIFFPSYGVMETCLEKWGGPATSSSSRSQGNGSSSFFSARKKRPTGSARYSFPFAPHTFSSSKEPMNPWKRLLGVKAVVVEPRSTTDLPDAINEFHKYLNMPKSKGVALFGVCRGKISEGIDFAHDMCRAVVITGLPFAPSFDPKVKMKREFLDQNRSAQNQKVSTEGGFGSASKTLCLSGHEWYTQQAHRAVNQAIGRVIRNKNDYGAVLLLDNRFSLSGNQEGLSKWVRPHILPDEGMGRTIGALSRFYKEAARKAEEREHTAPEPSSNPVSVILKYEEEGKENHKNVDDDNDDDKDVTKIAYIESATDQSSAGGATTENDGTSFIRPDRIIGRVELKDESSGNVLPNNFVDPTLSRAMPLDSSRPSLPARPVSTKSKEVQSDKKVAHPAKQDEKPQLTPAQRFFQIVLERMTPEEQSKMKHAAVAMKPLKGGKGEVGPKFIPAAREMINIILSYDKFEGKNREDKPEMITLLLQLVPKTYVLHVQALTISVLFDRSIFAKDVRERIERDEHLRFRSQLKTLLLNVWFKAAGGDYLSPQDYLSELERIISPFFISNILKSKQKIVHDFLELVPSEINGITNALFEQLEASTRIAKLRAKEKASMGEASYQASRFRSFSVKAEPPASDCVSQGLSTSETGPNDDIYQSSMKTEETKGKRANPYMKRAPSTERPSKAAKATGVAPADQDVKPKHGLLSSLMGNEKSKSTPNDLEDPVRKALNDLESDVFTGSNSRTTKAIESNAPKDWQCELCATQCEKVSLLSNAQYLSAIFMSSARLSIFVAAHHRPM